MLDAVSQPELAPLYDMASVEFRCVDAAGERGVQVGSEHGDGHENKEEARVLINDLKEMLNHKGNEGAKNFGVISGYRKQIDLLQRTFVEVMGSNVASKYTGGVDPRVQIGTLDSFQGNEKSVIMFSFVRCNERGDIGFLSKSQRVNVMLTRAKRNLVVYGS